MISLHATFSRFLRLSRHATLGMAGALLAHAAMATTPLSDGPAASNTSVPGNLAISLSVEFPTAVSVAHIGSTYDSVNTYLGYFDPAKCYLYQWNAVETQRHFYPSGVATDRKCTGTQDAKWSGNFLNWATMQTIDPFRWAMTGGYRVVDVVGNTLLEKAWHSGQGGTGNFPNRTLANSTLVSDNTPMAWGAFKMRVQGLGNKLRFTNTGDVTSSTVTEYNPAAALATTTIYELSVRVKVCDTTVGAGPLETNCTAFAGGNYKPTGLVQKYAERIRYSVFGYLNDNNLQRDGGVMRARMKFVGPTYALPGSPAIANPLSEWDASTGVMLANPDTADATATASAFGVTVSNSGFMNYVNKFGQITPGNYKSYDPVSELYYATLRYYRNLGNVPEWTNMTGATTATKATWVDGFPVITSWDDPILYACQKNFVLGFGDVNTHADKNVPGPSGTANEPAKPATVVADTGVNAVTATNKVGELHGLGATLGNTNPYGGCCNNNSALMAGLAYHANTTDVRPDDSNKPQTVGKQTVQTYWLDVLEGQVYKNNNQYYLAAKFGGFTVPNSFDPWARTTDLPLSWWSTTGETVYGQNRPDNYFIVSKPETMVAGLTAAFASIAEKSKAFTSAFAAALPQVAVTGSSSYSSQYDGSTWTGEVKASSNVFDISTGDPLQTEAWSFSAKLGVQLAGTGWDTARRMATWNDSSKAGVAFRLASLSASQQSALDTDYRAGNDAADYLNYLRGQRKNEVSSTESGGTKAYRDRSKLVGDIINSAPRAVVGPSAPYSGTTNPGYATFKSTWASRKPMVYVGTNAGILHAIDGSLTGSTAGREVFAYVPGALYSGPNGTPAVDGLQSLGKPEFTHYNKVDSPPAVMDVDFARTPGNSGAADWRTILVGGLGKGGKAYYALDVTDPSAFTTETATAGKVLWEFTDTDLGYTYGEPLAVKMKQYGWVLVFGSGYNNSDGKGYFFIVNPRTGALLQKVSTGTGSVSAQAGMAHVQGFVLDRTDGTVDALYGGDLLGNLWRLDVRAATGAFPAPTLVAVVQNAAGASLPITSRPLLVVQPGTNRRFITVGTGRMLHGSDISSSQPQAFYAVMDGTGLAFATASTLPSGISFPITKTKLRQLTNLTSPIVLDLKTEIGWWFEFSGNTGAPGWRVLSEPTSFNGIVAFSAMQPTGDACSPSGTSRVYAIDLGTGKSRLLAGTTSLPYIDTMPGVVRDLRFYSVNGEARLLAGSDTGATRKLDGSWVPTVPLRRLNWRELQVAN
jgi:type IV pilus assembly protein PilY1